MFFSSCSGWRLFDDSIVTPIRESQVVTNDAYLLFYHRRQPTVTNTICTRERCGDEVVNGDGEVECGDGESQGSNLLAHGCAGKFVDVPLDNEICNYTDMDSID